MTEREKLMEQVIQQDDRIAINRLKQEYSWSEEEFNDFEFKVLYDALHKNYEKGLVVPFEELVKLVEE